MLMFVRHLQCAAALKQTMAMVMPAWYMYGVVYFLFQLGALKTQNLQRMHVCFGTDYTLLSSSMYMYLFSPLYSTKAIRN
jgi:hypothetical protein